MDDFDDIDVSLFITTVHLDIMVSNTLQKVSIIQIIL